MLDDADGFGAGDGEEGGAAGKEDFAEVLDDFEDDDPPGVGDFDFGIGGFLGVVDDGLDLGFGEFDFHDEYAFVLFGLLGFVYRCGAKR